jgi:hypothetical protein
MPESFNNYKPRTVDILSFLYTIGYFTVLIIAFFVPFPAENKETLILLLGILSAVLGKIIEAYFSKDAVNSATATVLRSVAIPPTTGGTK